MNFKPGESHEQSPVEPNPKDEAHLSLAPRALKAHTVLLAAMATGAAIYSFTGLGDADKSHTTPQQERVADADATGPIGHPVTFNPAITQPKGLGDDNPATHRRVVTAEHPRTLTPSSVIRIHSTAPQESVPESLQEIWDAGQPHIKARLPIQKEQ